MYSSGLHHDQKYFKRWVVTLLTPGWQQDYTGKGLLLTEDIKAYLVSTSKGVGDIKPKMPKALLVMSRPGMTLSAAGQTSGHLKNAVMKKGLRKLHMISPHWHCFGCPCPCPPFPRHNPHSPALAHLPWSIPFRFYSTHTDIGNYLDKF